MEWQRVRARRYSRRRLTNRACICIPMHAESRVCCVHVRVRERVRMHPIKQLSCLIFHSSATMSGEREQTHLLERDVP